MALAAGAEPDAGRHRHLGLGHQAGGELDRAQPAIGLGDRGPHEHGAPGPLDLPADPVQAVAQGVAAAFVDGGGLGRVVGQVPQGDRGRDLDGLEAPVVEVALQLGQSRHHVGAAQHERHPPARHRKRLGHRIELHRALPGPGGLQDRRGPVPVEAQVGVGVVVNDEQVPVSGEVHHLLHEAEIDAGGGGVVGERHHRHPGLGEAVLPGGVKPVEELFACAQRRLAGPALGRGGGAQPLAPA